MKQQLQRGSVLVTSLLLLLVITIIGVSGMTNSRMSERLAGNQKQVSEAFMAAESGLVHAKSWLDQNGILWGDSEQTTAKLAELAAQHKKAGVFWNIESLVYTSALNNVAEVTSCGNVDNSNVKRCVSFQYLQAKGAANLAALNLIGKNILFKDPNSGAIRFVGDDGGPAIAINTDATSVSVQELIDALNEIARKEAAGETLTDLEKKLKQVYANGGGIERVDFGDPFGDPQKLADFVASVKNDFCGCRTTKSYCSGITADPAIHTPTFCANVGNYNPDSFGVIGKEKLVYIEGAPNTTVTVDFKGNAKGAGVMVVVGNVIFSGTPTYDGLLVVVGDSFEVKGGGNGGINGALAITNVVDVVGADGTVTKEFGDTSADFSGGGTSDYFYNEDRLVDVREKLLSDSTKDLWVLEDGDNSAGTTGKTGSVFGWMQTY